MGMSTHLGRHSAKDFRSNKRAPANATTGGHHIFVNSISDGRAVPMIQYGTRAFEDPVGKLPTGKMIHPARHAMATAVGGAKKRNNNRVAIANTANITSTIAAPYHFGLEIT